MGNLSSLLVILIAFVGAYFMRFDISNLENSYLLVLLTGLLLSSVILPATGAYRTEFRWDLMRRVRRLVAGWAVVVMSLLTVATLLKITAEYSRIWFGLWVVFGVIGLVLTSLFQSAWLRYRGKTQSNRRRLVLVGSGDAAGRVESRMSTDRSIQFDVVARFGAAWDGHDVEDISKLESYVTDQAVDDVWIAAELEDKALLESALAALKNSVVDVHVVPDLYQYRLLNQNVSEWQGLPVISLSGTPMTGSEWRLKAAMDRAGSALLLALSSPLLILIGVAVKVSSPGPALFHQLRHGMGGEPIEIFKFRTMKVHQEPEGQYTQAHPDDQRITWVGSWLRRSSLDELPQLINVLKGEMSLVGPRPHPVELNQQFLDRIPKYMFRHKAKPGMTGWAQVNGLRGQTDTEEKMTLRIEHDLWYIQNWSLWLDLQILMRTPFAMVGRDVF